MLPDPADHWSPEALPAGTAVHGFRVQAVLGQGGFGITYLVADLLGQRFALKECFPGEFARRAGALVAPRDAAAAEPFADCRRRFLEEAEALVRLAALQPGEGPVVRILTIFEANGTAYSLMEYLPGQSLEARLRAAPDGLPPAELAALLRGLLQGLRLVHGAGLAHRDIKPANILLREDGRPVLIDFGSARMVDRPGDAGFTRIYTASYAPIEQVLGTAQGPFSDLYALGAVGYRALGGRLVPALARHNAAQAGAADPLRPAAALGQGRYPPRLLALLDAALAMDPAGRPASAEAMLRQLEAASADDDAPTRLAPSPTPARRPGRVLAILGLVALVVGGLAAATLLRRPAPELAAPGGPALPSVAGLVAPLPGSVAGLPAALAPPPGEWPALAPAASAGPPAGLAAAPRPPVSIAAEPALPLPARIPQPPPAAALPQPPAAVPPPALALAPRPAPALAPPEPPATPRPPPEPAARRPAANPATAARCRAVLARAQLGETLSEPDRALLRSECRG